MTKPQNVLVMRDISCAGYVAGNNQLFFSDKGSMQEAQQEIQKRLSFSEGVGHKYKSLLAFPCHAGQLENNIDNVLSITTRLLPWEVSTAMGGGMHKSFPGGEEMYRLYMGPLGLKTVHFGEDVKAAENMEFISQVCLPHLSVPPVPCGASCLQMSSSNVCSVCM